MTAMISSCWEERNFRIFLRKSSMEETIFRKMIHQFQEWIILYKSTELFSVVFLARNLLKEKLPNAETVWNITEMVEDKIDDYLLNVFPEKYPITSIFCGAKRKAQIKMDLLDEVQHAVPELLNAYAQQIDEKIDIEAIVTEKVENLNSDMLEKLLNNILKSEFKFIEWVGAILGFLIGIVQILVSELL